MTANLQPASIIAAIADVVVTGWNIYDLTNIPAEVDTRQSAAFWPDIGEFITDLEISDATNGGPEAAKDANYILSYIFAYKRVEAGRSITEYLSDMVTAWQTLMNTLITTSFAAAGGIRVTPNGIRLGIVKDPLGNEHFGGFVKLRVLEFVQ